MPRRLDDELRLRVPMLVDARTNTVRFRGRGPPPRQAPAARFIKFPGATTKGGLATAGIRQGRDEHGR